VGSQFLTRLLALGLVLFGAFTFAAVIASKLAFSAEMKTSVMPRGAPGAVLFRDDFVDGIDPLWQMPPASHVGETCLYPHQPQVSGGLLILGVETHRAMCAGMLWPYRGEVLQTRVRFTPPFKVIARMRVAGGPGVVSSLFTYSDPYDGTPHFENDLEFPGSSFGRDHVWINQFAPWAPPAFGDEASAHLAFDASEDFHDYEIDVFMKETIWLVDGEVARFTPNFDPPPPENVNVNAWFAPRWMGEYDQKIEMRPHGRHAAIDFVEVDALSESDAP
jgi:hypothetical protein